MKIDTKYYFSTLTHFFNAAAFLGISFLFSLMNFVKRKITGRAIEGNWYWWRLASLQRNYFKSLVRFDELMVEYYLQDDDSSSSEIQKCRESIEYSKSFIAACTAIIEKCRKIPKENF